MVFFVILAFIPLQVGSRSYIFIFTILIFGGWIGFVLILISLIRIKNDCIKIPSSYKMYITGIVLIIINYLFFAFLTWIRSFSVYLFVSVYFIVVISGFFIGLVFLRTAKSIFSSNSEQILETKKVEETEKLQTLYCPRCKTKVKADSTSCSLCNQDFNEFPPITHEEKSFKYCPHCQKNVKTHRKFGAGFCISFIIILVVALIFRSLFWFIAPIGWFLFYALRSPRCSNCNKKTEPPRFLTVPPTQDQKVQSQGQEKDEKICPNCGNLIKPSMNNYCEYCGKKIEE